MTKRPFLALVLAALAALLLVGPVHAAATITIVNANGPGVGFNDPTPVAPVGGNTGTTIGQQRLIAFQYAADLWGATLDSSVPIEVLASFEPLACNATQAVLGSAGARTIWRDFPGALIPNTWYSAALANKLARADLFPPPDPDGQDFDKDIRARFNINLGTLGCLTGIGWYLGLDQNHGTQIDLVTVLLHEFAHGLGFQQFATLTTGAMIEGLPDAYNRRLLDLTTGKTWDQMTDAERVASAINWRKVAWTGGEVTSAVPGVLAPGTPLLDVLSPAGVAGKYPVGTAAFGPALTSPGVTGDLVVAIDPDGCSPFTNAAAIAGKIAVVDRGTCSFTVKVKNAQNAGAIGVVVVNNSAASPITMGGADATITIPSVMVSLADGAALKAAIAGGTVTATMGVDLTVRAGASPAGLALMNSPSPVQPGSSISHWDPIAFPNQLMEPGINSDLTHSVEPPADLTLPLLRDVGWFPDADLDGVADGIDCEPNSDLGPIFVYQFCNSGVPNLFFPDGCTLSDLVAHFAASAQNHGELASNVAQLAEDLLAQGLITEAQKDAIVSCVASSKRRGSQNKPSDEPTGLTAERFSVRFAARNPGVDGARLEMAVPKSSHVSLEVYDVRGALVWSLGRTFEPGVHAVAWDGRDDHGRQAAGGVYFIRATNGEDVETLRFVKLN